MEQVLTIGEIDLAGICDNYEPHLKTALQKAGGKVPGFSDYKEMMRKLKPQAVIICVPLHLHFQLASEAIESGIAVFLEKTMCFSLDEAERLKALVNQKKSIFQVGTQRRANGVYRQAMAMIETGMLGKIISIKCQWHRNNNWRRAVPVEKSHPDYPALERKLNWRLYNEYSRGLFAELASHQLDVVSWALKTHPTSVMASGGTDYWKDGREVADNVFSVFDYKMNDPVEGLYQVRATFSSISANSFEDCYELIMGEKGTLFLTSGLGLFYPQETKGKSAGRADIQSKGYSLKSASNPWSHRAKPIEFSPEGDDARLQLVAFAKSVLQNNTATLADVEEGYENTRTVLAACKSMETGQKVLIR